MLASRCLYLVAMQLLLGVGAAEPKGKASTCNTCQSVAHLLVVARKTLAHNEAESGSTGIVGSLFTNRTEHVCNEEKLRQYAEFLELKAKTMVKKCNEMVPEKFEYKSAQDLRTALVEKKPRSAVAKLLCIDSKRCDQLWSHEEEPWRNWNKKRAGGKGE